MNEKKIKYYLLGAFLSLVFFLLFGIVTALIPNSLFIRMIGARIYDYVFLAANSILLGAYFAIHQYKKTSAKCDRLVYSGGILGFLAFACPVCNKLLVVLFSTTALLTYFEPYRPFLGLVSIFLLVIAIFYEFISNRRKNLLQIKIKHIP